MRMTGKLERFEAPPSFEAACFASEGKGRIDMQDVQSSRKELWLIKAPANFAGSQLNGVNLDLGGDPTEFSAADDKVYEAVGAVSLKENEEKSPYLLLPAENGKTLEPAPRFKGHITIMESLNLPESSRLPDIEPSQAPKMPEGLRQRFLPFGWEEPLNASSRPACASPARDAPRGTETLADRGKSPHLDATPQTGRGEEECAGLDGRESSKKKKKRKRRQGQEEDIEDGATEQQLTSVATGGSSSKKKKKKKSKD